MFKVDQQWVSGAWLARRRAELRADPVIAKAERIACWVQAPADWLALVELCRAEGKSCAPLHPGLPEAQLSARAQALGCDALLRGRTAEQLATAATPAPEPGLVQLTSGTTGTPRALLRSWSSIAQELAAYNESLLVDGEVTPLITAPVHHAYGLIAGFLSGLARGAAPHILTGQNPKVVAAAVAAAEAPLLYSSPVYLEALTKLWPAEAAWPAVMTSGSPMPAAWFAECQARGPVWQQYGCSELGAVALTRAAAGPQHLGRPLAHWTLTAGTRAAPAAVLVHPARVGAAVATGDLGYLEDGELYFSARADDTIVNAGQNVYPAEVEAALAQLEGVQEVVVLGLPDARAGTRVAALFTASRTIAGGEWRRHCEQHLAPYQWPTRFRQVVSIERMPGGKLSRRALAADWQAAMEGVA